MTVPLCNFSCYRIAFFYSQPPYFLPADLILPDFIGVRFSYDSQLFFSIRFNVIQFVLLTKCGGGDTLDSRIFFERIIYEI